ncbi:cytochrome c oxidase assembly protein [Serinibacter arcticus]|uniref:cytochrome c oxidase assembly protein n=1 Tax=Serinibacter arcticus TaxID=1655435 RepID=UPI001F1DE86E|nr:cytochrome c oxidase assembly protein [Serinibacter arcticus]
MVTTDAGAAVKRVPLGLALVAGAVLVVVATLVGIALSGAATPTLLGDPGAFVRWGLPVVDALVETACAVTVGALVLAAVVLPRSATATDPSRVRRAGAAGRAWPLAQKTAAWASVVWTVALVVQLLLTYARVSGTPLGGEQFGAELGVFLTQIELGQAMAWGLLLTALASLLAVAASGYTSALAAAIVALAALAPVAQTGHAAGAANHTLAVGSLWLHLAGVTVWIGGLAVLAVVAGRLGKDLVPSAERYSAIAIWAYALVAVSGVVNASIRLGSLENLGTPYGVLLILKVVAVVALGAAGYLHRRRTIPSLTSGRTTAFWRLVGVEILIAGATMGIASALSNTAPPVPDVPLEGVSPAEAITGSPVPGEPTLLGWITGFSPDVLVLTGVVSAAVVVLGWYLRLRRRGDHWPLGRVVSIMVGLLLIAWTSSGGAAVYGHILFSAHMVQHMVLVMLAPIFLVLGAPVTLAVRALPSRPDGTRGPRELLLGLVHSKVAGFFSHPVVAAVNVAGSMVVFYYTPLFGLSLSNHLVHLWMIVHFTLAGYLFVNVLVGIDPGPKRPSYPLRLVLLFATMAFHAFFGLSLTMGTSLLAAPWFGALGLPWGVDALVDQQYGGAFAWGFGEVPSLALAIALGLAWLRDDERTAKRQDRAADRDGGADLEAYNAMLSRMSRTGDRAPD